MCLLPHSSELCLLGIVGRGILPKAFRNGTAVQHSQHGSSFNIHIQDTGTLSLKRKWDECGNWHRPIVELSRQVKTILISSYRKQNNRKAAMLPSCLAWRRISWEWCSNCNETNQRNGTKRQQQTVRLGQLITFVAFFNLPRRPVREVLHCASLYQWYLTWPLHHDYYLIRCQLDVLPFKSHRQFIYNVTIASI